MIRDRRILASLGLATLALALAPDAGAQSLEPVRTSDFGVAAGVAVPVGNGTDGLSPGFTVGGAFGVRPVNMPVSFRFEATYTRLGIQQLAFPHEGGFLGTDGHVSFLGGIGNVILPIPSASSIRPYVIGGLGVFRVKGRVNVSLTGVGGTIGASESESQTRLGLNGGAGIEFPLRSLRAFAEARFQSVFTEGQNSNFIPVTIGVKF